MVIIFNFYNMKNILSLFITVATTACLLASCLKSDFDDLESFDGTEITGISGVFYRYYGNTTDIIPGSGEVRVYQAPLAYDGFVSDAENGTVHFTVSVRSEYLPPEEVAKVTTSCLVVTFNISTAAVIEPLPSSAKLGVIADWSKPNQYKVTAANGDFKIWTVSLEMLDK